MAKLECELTGNFFEILDSIENEITNYLNIDDLEQVSTLIIGYPEEIPERSKRFSIDKLLLNNIHKDSNHSHP